MELLELKLKWFPDLYNGPTFANMPKYQPSKGEQDAYDRGEWIYVTCLAEALIQYETNDGGFHSQTFQGREVTGVPIHDADKILWAGQIAINDLQRHLLVFGIVDEHGWNKHNPTNADIIRSCSWQPKPEPKPKKEKKDSIVSSFLSRLKPLKPKGKKVK